MSKLRPCKYQINRYNKHHLDYHACIAVHTCIELLYERQIMVETVIAIFDFVFYEKLLEFNSDKIQGRTSYEATRLVNGHTTRAFVHASIQKAFEEIDCCDDWSYDFDRTIAMHHLSTFVDRMNKLGFHCDETF